VDGSKASALAGTTLGKADAGLIRAQTGFVIGGVAPIGHLEPICAWWDPRLSEFSTVWAAAGTPRHVFAIAPGDLLALSGASVADFVEA
jgi:prolyl-tRNA editing enzyme YbaK/EbsC (Cys-tRNA(Pro) deacylase)